MFARIFSILRVSGIQIKQTNVFLFPLKPSAFSRVSVALCLLGCISYQ